MAYDIIGDIHGRARELRALLEKMSYREPRKDPTIAQSVHVVRKA